MNTSIYKYLGYIPHLFVLITYIACIFLLLLKRVVYYQLKYIIYFFSIFFLTIITFFVPLQQKYILSEITILIDLLFFLIMMRIYEYKIYSIMILSFILLLYVYFLQYFSHNLIVSLLSISSCLAVFLISLFSLRSSIKNKDSQEFIESKFWFYASYLFYSILMMACDLTIVIGQFNADSLTVFLIYYVIFIIWIIKSILLTKSYLCLLKINF
jgi:hypothetical protein